MTDNDFMRTALAECVVRENNLIGERDRLQQRLDRVVKFCADKTDGDSPIHDGLLARICWIAEGLV